MSSVDSVSAIILNTKSEILVGERRGSIGRGLLTFPGGKVDLVKTKEGNIVETHLKAIYREVIEEACMRISNLKYFEKAETKLAEEEIWETYFYLATSNDIPYVIEPEGQVNWQWMALEKFNIPDENFFYPLNDLIIKINSQGSRFGELVLNKFSEIKNQDQELKKLF